MHKVSGQWTPEFISVGFIAKGCGVSNTTVLRWISTGQIPAFRLPSGHYRVERNDFSEFLDRHGIPAQDKSPGIVKNGRGSRKIFNERGDGL